MGLVVVGEDDLEVAEEGDLAAAAASGDEAGDGNAVLLCSLHSMAFLLILGYGFGVQSS